MNNAWQPSKVLNAPIPRTKRSLDISNVFDNIGYQRHDKDGGVVVKNGSLGSVL